MPWLANSSGRHASQLCISALFEGCDRAEVTLPERRGCGAHETFGYSTAQMRQGRRQPTVTVMYQPNHHRVEDVREMHALMRARPLAVLVSAGPAGLDASHLPTVLKDEGRYGVIECHLARANPHCRDL